MENNILNFIGNSHKMGAAIVTQESLITIIQNIINFLMVIGIALAVVSAVAALVISLLAGERTKDTWYGRCKLSFAIGVGIVLIPGAFKLVLGWVGQSDKFKLEGSIKDHVSYLYSNVDMSIAEITNKFKG